ncbi:hypothetical protein D9611_006504 [Ephemerocybe angulata]|uniref:Uncharacterized protein n=1 Tax=Ephemerocybe angulata TaxID=980116 RepID=A0A8H5C9M6_9AGAR|nr:hypothetical protein D9611_006504 [Tulosesus angulatus]
MALDLAMQLPTRYVSKKRENSGYIVKSRLLTSRYPTDYPAFPFYFFIGEELERYRLAIGESFEKIEIQIQDRRRFRWVMLSNDTESGQDRVSKVHALPPGEYDARNTFKAVGNLAFEGGKAALAIMRYGQAQGQYENTWAIFGQKIDEEARKKFIRQCAILFANRSAAYLLPGETKNISAALDDARRAITADPLCPKGYARLAKAHLARNDLSSAQDAIAEGLRLPKLRNEGGLVNTLIDLQTGGKGLPRGVEELRHLAKTLIQDDEESAKRVKDIQGLWRESPDPRGIIKWSTNSSEKFQISKGPDDSGQGC